MMLRNTDFYNGEEFLPEAAKKSYFEMLESFSWPVSNRLRDEDEGMWVLDFALGDFANVGMGGIFWINDEEYKYFGHEIFLLPGQMIVEHCHVGLNGVAPKMEAWHVRRGSIYTFGEGPESNECPVELPESQKEFITVQNVQKLEVDEIARLNRPEARHFMVAGPEGAIVTEYATFHSMEALRFTNPRVKL